MSDLTAFAAFAEELADAARAAVSEVHAGEWATEDKGRGRGFDPVTRADRDAERAMRELIEKRFPDHGIAGEEYGTRRASGPHSWSLDPIDGTRSFICGLPSWTILVALVEEGRPVVGVIDAPRLNERYVGYGDLGRLVTPSGRHPLSTSGCRSLAEARLSTTDPHLFSASERERFEAVRRQARLARYGLDGYAYAKLAAGGLDLVIESALAPHDVNALVPVVVAAGGAVSNWRGEADVSDGHIVAAASTSLLDEALRLIRG